MEAQVHILCSHCEKVLVEVPKEKVQTQKGNVSNIPEKPSSVEKTTNKIESPLNFKSESQEEEESSYCEIKIDYSKNENIQSASRLTGEIRRKSIIPESGTIDSTALDRVKRIMG